MTKFTHGVRVVAHDGRNTGWVQTGFTREQAEDEAERLNELGILPGVTYEAARVSTRG